jgi:hypothetical protein
MTRPPIACALTTTGREQRARLVAALAEDALISRERDGTGLVVRFRADAGVERRLRAWTALEAECCPFLTMSVEPGSAVVTLRVDGPSEAAGIIDELLPPLGSSGLPVD